MSRGGDGLSSRLRLTGRSTGATGELASESARERVGASGGEGYSVLIHSRCRMYTISAAGESSPESKKSVE